MNTYSIDGRSIQTAKTAIDAARQSIRDRYAPNERDLLKHWRVEDINQTFEGWQYFTTYYKGEVNGQIRVKQVN